MTSVSVDPFTMSPDVGSSDESGGGYKIMVALLFALAVHLSVVFGISFEMPKPAPSVSVETIDIIVVNRQGPASALTDGQEPALQNTLDDTAGPAAPIEQAEEEAVEPKEPAITQPPMEEPEAFQAPLPDPFTFTAPVIPPETAQPLVASVVRPEQTELVEVPVPTPEPVEPPPVEPPPPREITAAEILASRDLEIAHLSARIKPGSNAYGNNTRRKAINARTREFKYATYLDAWRKKVERIGNLNYPQEAKRKGLFGNLILHVALLSDGSIETLRIVRSSGHALLDEAAMDIVRLAAPYAAFPEDIKSETDVLDITRTWQFLRGDRFSW